MGGKKGGGKKGGGNKRGGSRNKDQYHAGKYKKHVQATPGVLISVSRPADINRAVGEWREFLDSITSDIINGEIPYDEVPSSNYDIEFGSTTSMWAFFKQYNEEHGIKEDTGAAKEDKPAVEEVIEHKDTKDNASSISSSSSSDAQVTVEWSDSKVETNEEEKSEVKREALPLNPYHEERRNKRK